MNQQTTAPPTCRACGYVVLVSITQGQRVERYDRCEHPSGPHPMHEGTSLNTSTNASKAMMSWSWWPWLGPMDSEVSTRRMPQASI